jgi:hypothetical protein
MIRAAIGIRAHSGWGAAVSVSGGAAKIEVLDRRRIAITDPSIEGANQPYHFAQQQRLSEAEKYLADCAAVSERLAFDALDAIVRELRSRGYDVASCAILVASGRALPSLPQILAAHPLIHTAEGEFFRHAFRKAGERLGLPVTGVRERELDARVAAVFGSKAPGLQREIAALGRSLGPPWTTDQKTAALAALLTLAVAGERTGSMAV